MIHLHTLLWLFPIAFMLHDFEEIIFWEAWLRKNGAEVTRRLPAILKKPVGKVVEKTTAQAAFSIVLIFGLTVLTTFWAVEYQQYGPFLLASGLFFIHGFVHLGQAVILRRYVPAVITSALVILPYGLALYPRLMAEGIVGWGGLLASGLLGLAAMIPFILALHAAGDYLYEKAARWLIR